MKWINTAYKVYFCPPLYIQGLIAYINCFSDYILRGRPMDSRPFEEKILVVEDDDIVRDYIQNLLSPKGYTVRAVSKGYEALDLISREYFPVILTDLILPDRRGIEILDFVHKKGIPSAVLIVTAYKSTDAVIEALRYGAYDYITKPFTSQILLHRIARAMEKVRMEETTKDLSSRIVYATEEERRRISRDIHDGIGQSLAIIKLTLTAIRKKIGGNREIVSEIDGLATFVEDTMEEVSRITKDLNPSYVTEVGFLQAIKLYTETFSKNTGIQVHCSLPERLHFDNPKMDIHFYRIAQEAMTNIAKHSGATKAEIRLEQTGDIIRFSITDNGKGFNASEAGRTGLGLIGMRERAFSLGGKVWIESMPHKGTTITMEVPYAPTR